MSSAKVGSPWGPDQLFRAHQPSSPGRKMRRLFSLSAQWRSMNFLWLRVGWSQAHRRERTYQRWWWKVLISIRAGFFSRVQTSNTNFEP